MFLTLSFKALKFSERPDKVTIEKLRRVAKKAVNDDISCVDKINKMYKTWIKCGYLLSLFVAEELQHTVTLNATPS